MKRLIAYTHTLDDPASRFRIRQYIPHLERAGWTVSLRTNHPPRPWISAYRNRLIRTLHQRSGVLCRRLWRLWDIHAASGFDAVFVNRDLLEGRTEYEQRLLRRNPRVVFDFDDAIFLGHKATHVQWICERAAWVTAGNSYLASFASRFTERVTVLPTVVDADAYEVRAADDQARAVRIGWLGSDRSIRETLFPHLDMLARLQARIGFEFVVVSRPRPEIPAGPLRWSFIEWSPVTETRIARLFDIGIMPLVDDEFQRGKCGCKLLQYMAAGLPSVASPVGLNSRLLEGGARGFLAASEDDWERAFTSLAADAALRYRLGAGAREFVEKEYSVRTWFPVLLEILERAATAGVRHTSS